MDEFSTEVQSTQLEVFYVGGVISLAPTIIRYFLSRLMSCDRYWPAGYLRDSVSTLLPSLLLMTGSISPQLAFLFTTSIAVCMLIPNLFSLTEENSLVCLKDLNMPRLRYLDDFRGDFMLATCIAILAVDFKTFPKRFAKSETYGTTVMDLGPGVIIFAGGLVTKPSPRGKIIHKSFCLICFGLVRLMVTVLTGYIVNENEYGRHWNFFFTLAGVSLLNALIPVYSGLLTVSLAASVLCFYQFLLNSGLGEYIHSVDHTGNLINQNKEGLYSVIGYWCLHLFGAFVGKLLRLTANYCLEKPGPDKLKTKTGNSARFWLLSWYCFITGLTLCFYTMTYVSKETLDGVSRRSCNLTYVFWISAYSMSQCLWKITIQVFELEKNVLLTKSINKNLLGVFLAANLMTGVVNLTMDTQMQTTEVSVIILSIYGLFLTFGAAFAEKHEIYLKV